MSNVSRVIIVLAALTAIMPYLGFPAVFKNGFVLASGIIIAGLLYLKEKHMLHTRKKNENVHADTFVESGAGSDSRQKEEQEQSNT